MRDEAQCLSRTEIWSRLKFIISFKVTVLNPIENNPAEYLFFANISTSIFFEGVDSKFNDVALQRANNWSDGNSRDDKLIIDMQLDVRSEGE